MFWIALAIIATIAATIYGYCYGSEGGDEDVVIGILFAILFFIGSALCSGAICVIPLAITMETVPYSQDEYEYELAAIDTGDYTDIEGSIHGSRFYVRGEMSSTLRTEYKVYRRLTDNSYKQEHIPSENAIIMYSNEQPKVHVTTYTCPEKEIKFWNITNCEAPADEYILYVPEGSIIKQINL